VRQRGLSGEALRPYLYVTRARLGTDAALDLALRLLERARGDRTVS